MYQCMGTYRRWERAHFSRCILRSATACFGRYGVYRQKGLGGLRILTLTFAYNFLEEIWDGACMKRSFPLWQLLGFAVTSLGGTLLHFLYDFSGKAVWAAPFSGVNESTWEHMKLLFWPMLLFGIVQSFFFRERKDFWCVKLYGTLLGLGLIPLLFYTYNGAVGKSPAQVNISIFFLAAGAAYLLEARLYAKGGPCNAKKSALGTLLLLALLFVIFTFAPPRIGLFEDPLTGSFGI